jgi:hypothetical protein
MIRAASLVLLIELAAAADGFASPAPKLCRLEHVIAAPVGGDKATYEARGAAVSVIFHSERVDRPVTTFPEPPVEIRAESRACRIQDGGVWHAGGVFLATDGRRALLEETSGSAVTLVLYDSRTCRRLREIDATGADWNVVGRFVDLRLRRGGRDRSVRIDLCRG